MSPTFSETLRNSQSACCSLIPPSLFCFMWRVFIWKFCSGKIWETENEDVIFNARERGSSNERGKKKSVMELMAS